MFPGGALLDVLGGVGHMNDALHINAGRVDVVRVELAGGHEMLDLRDGDLAGCRHHRIEIARGLSEDEIALMIAHPGVDQRHIGDEPRLHDVILAIENARLLALGHQRAKTRLGVEGGNAGAAGANALGQCALRVELDLQFSAQKLLREQLILADIGRDHLLHLLRLQQDAKADAVHAGIVGDEGEVLCAGLFDGLDQRLGDAAEAKTAGHEGHAVLDQPGHRRSGVGVNFFHERNSLLEYAAPQH